MNETEFYKKLSTLPDGVMDVWFRERRYLFRKQTLLNGKLIKVFAQELGNTDIISGNYYTSIQGGLLKPCEMSSEKVINFIAEISF